MSELEDLRVEVRNLTAAGRAVGRGHERLRVELTSARAEVARLGLILSNLDCEGEGYECLTHQSKWVDWDAPIGECVWIRDYEVSE